MAAPRIFYRAKKRRGPAAFVFMMVLFKEKFLTFCNSHGSQKYQRTLKPGALQMQGGYLFSHRMP